MIDVLRKPPYKLLRPPLLFSVLRFFISKSNSHVHLDRDQRHQIIFLESPPPPSVNLCLPHYRRQCPYRFFIRNRIHSIVPHSVLPNLIRRRPQIQPSSAMSTPLPLQPRSLSSASYSNPPTAITRSSLGISCTTNYASILHAPISPRCTYQHEKLSLISTPLLAPHPHL
jgi:hypothetical protein